jgi:hypothetical protein
MPELSGITYSEVDGSNNQAAPNGMPEGMPPSGVNDAWRAGMGAIKRSYDRDHAGTWCTVGGTGNAITLAYAVAPASYVQGEKYAFKAIAANSGATTVNINGLGAKSVFKKTLAGTVACTGNEIQNGDLVELEYDGTQFQIMGQAANAGSFAGGTLTLATNMSGAAFNEAQVSIASATTTNIGAAAANYLSVTGTTAITAFDAVQAGTERTLEFQGALTLTNNAAIILPGGANITTAAGDTAIFRSEGAGNWRCVSYMRANGQTIYGTAVKSDMQATTDTNKVVTVVQVQNHPGVAKAWVLFDGTQANPITPSAQYGISGTITKNGTGDYTITFSTAFASANFAAVSMGGNSTNNQTLVYGPIVAPTTTTFRFAVSDTATQVDRARLCLAFFGAQ